jgi:hypothetical protein
MHVIAKYEMYIALIVIQRRRLITITNQIGMSPEILVKYAITATWGMNHKVDCMLYEPCM